MSAAAIHPMLVGASPARRRIIEAGLLANITDPEAVGRRDLKREAEERALKEAQADIEREARLARLKAERDAQINETLREAAERSLVLSPWRVAIREVCEAHDVVQRDLIGPSRLAKVIIARHELCYRLVVDLKLSLSEAGRRIGRDHSSVYHGYRKHAARHGLPLLPGLTRGRTA